MGLGIPPVRSGLETSTDPRRWSRPEASSTTGEQVRVQAEGEQETRNWGKGRGRVGELPTLAPDTRDSRKSIERRAALSSDCRRRSESGSSPSCAYRADCRSWCDSSDCKSPGKALPGSVQSAACTGTVRRELSCAHR